MRIVMTSTSAEGVSSISLEFQEGVDMGNWTTGNIKTVAFPEQTTLLSDQHKLCARNGVCFSEPGKYNIGPLKGLVIVVGLVS